MSSNLAFSNSTSERYALALYELAKEKSELDKTENEIQGLKHLLITSDDFKNMVSNPTIGRDEQVKAILKICEFLNFSQTVNKFLGLLTFKGRLFFLNKIINSFLKLTSSNRGELTAALLSSKKLTEQQIDIIQKDISEYLKRSLKINYKYDPNLIGGFIIQVGSIMIDTSIKSKLKKLEEIMID